MAGYEVDPDEIFDKAIKDALKKVDDLTIPYKLMTREWFKGNRSIFDVGRLSRGKYRDLSTKPFTVFWERPETQLNDFYPGGYKEYKKAKYGLVYPILRATGQLAESMTNPSSSDSVNIIVNKTILILGTKVKSDKGKPYGIYQQLGSKKTNLPARPFVLLGGEQVATPKINQRRKTWVEMLGDYVLQVSKGFAD